MNLADIFMITSQTRIALLPRSRVSVGNRAKSEMLKIFDMWMRRMTSSASPGCSDWQGGKCPGRCRAMVASWAGLAAAWLAFGTPIVATSQEPVKGPDALVLRQSSNEG